ncbi:proteasome subunit alpha type-2-like [Rhodnius prolixus]|uniref:proteasome subunit alpha type-2-like n=1 Tax=Rhodnius prolixus TaxID=13249 RepID=UPI003D18E87C
MRATIYMIIFFETVKLEHDVNSANLTLKEGFEGQITAHNIEVGVCDEAGILEYWIRSRRDYLANIP